jgi:hypothetical protein
MSIRTFVLVAVLAGLGWWYFIEGRKMTEERVAAFYQKQDHATRSRDPEALCALLADDFQGQGTSVAFGQRFAATQNKEEACAAYRQLYQNIADIGAKLGGMAYIDYDHNVESVELARDRKSATAQVRFSMKVAGRVMHYRGQSTDILVRRGGRVLLQRSDEKSSVGPG